jgi:hypothetical protein
VTGATPIAKPDRHSNDLQLPACGNEVRLGECPRSELELYIGDIVRSGDGTEPAAAVLVEAGDMIPSDGESQ